MSTERATSPDECIEAMQDSKQAMSDSDEEEMSFTSSSDSNTSTNFANTNPLWPKEMIVSYKSHSTGKVISEHIVKSRSNHDSDEEDESDSDASTGDSSFDQTLSSHGEYDEAQPTQLCVHCQNIANNGNLFTTTSHCYFPHWESPYALESSAESGCSLCFQFCLQWKSRKYGNMEESKKDYDKWVLDRAGRIGGVVNSLFGGSFWIMTFQGFDSCELEDYPFSKGLSDDSLRLRHRVTVEAIPISRGHGSGINLQPREQEFGSTRDSIVVLKEWMGVCCDRHGKCHILDNSFRPSRLIYLGDEHPRLRLYKDLETTPKYATLSHCWGNIRFKTLTKQTEKAFVKQIPPEALSATFNEAILVVKELGLQYLWIDSLCIVQDDEIDWAKESALMIHVYSNSTLNIAASKATDGSQGLFASRSRQWLCHISRFLEAEAVQYRCIPDRYYDIAMDSPLETRGWTLQERLLATRTLHFTEFEVFWECCEEVACESFPNGYLPSAQRDEFFRVRDISVAQWSSIIYDYCYRQLTMSKDRLVAISGIARQIQSKSQDQYIAGIWARGIEEQLCWFRLKKKRAYSPPYKQIPTWSWASMRNQFIFFQEDDFREFFAKVFKADIVTLHDDPFGELVSARLHINCDGLFYAECEDGTRSGHDTYIIMGHKRIGCSLYFDHAEHYDNMIHVMPVGTYFKESIHSLLLKPTGKQQGHYQRIGYLRFGQSDSDSLSYGFDDVHNDPDCQAKESDYIPRDMSAVGGHTIILV